MRWLFCCAVLLAAGSCGLADDGRAEENKYIYPVFSDKTFEAWCLRQFDLDGNGRISRYEAQRVLHLDCSGLGIATLYDIAEFSNLRTLNCSGNDLASLDVSMLAHLERLDCARNRLASLDVGGLRGLAELDCSDNPLVQLDLASNGSLSRFVAQDCRFVTLDLSGCSLVMSQVDVSRCPDLGVIYISAGQRIESFNYDASATVISR